MDKNSENSANLFFCGDFCSTPSTSFISVSEELKDILKSCDLKVCNFEGPIESSGKSLTKVPPIIQQSPDAPSFLESLGFNVISLANNHALDFGDDGYFSTKRAFTKAMVAGAGTLNEVYTIHIFRIKGLKIGIFFLTYASFGAFDTNPIHDESIGCAYINHLCVNHLILNCRKDLDFLIIYVHNGIEYFDVPFPEQRARYKDLIDYGVDAVIGHHSHTPQGWEVYKGCPIFYSLGNFFFNSKSTPDFKAKRYCWYNGLAVQLILDKDKPILFKVYNVLNDRNRKIVLDNSASILSFTNNLCEILKDDEAYAKKIGKITDELWIKKYLPSMFCGFVRLIFHVYLFLFLKSMIKPFILKDSVIIYSLLRNNNHRDIMIRALKTKNNFI